MTALLISALIITIVLPDNFYMEIFGFIIVNVIVFIAAIMVLFSIIKSAMSRELLEREALRQSLYLRHLALKSGVSEEVLESIDRSLDKKLKS